MFLVSMKNVMKDDHKERLIKLLALLSDVFSMMDSLGNNVNWFYRQERKHKTHHKVSFCLGRDPIKSWSGLPDLKGFGDISCNTLVHFL